MIKSVNIRNGILVCFLGFLSLFVTTSVYSQVTYGATPVSATVTHRTCFSNSSASLTLVYNVVNTSNPVSGGAYVCGTDYTMIAGPTKFEIREGTSISGALVATYNPTAGQASCVSAYGGFNITCTIDLSSVVTANGVYTIWPTIYVSDIRAGRSVIATSSSRRFLLGQGAEWGDMIDMSISPNSSSCKRSVLSSGQTYAGTSSLNQLNASENGWVDVGAQFSATQNGSVYVVFGRTSGITTFSTTPTSSDYFYLIFTKTGASTGTVSVKTNTTTYSLTGVTHTSRIYVERSLGNTVKFYRDGLVSLVSGSPTLTNTTDWNIATFSDIVDNGSLSVGMTFPCRYNTVMYAEIERELSGVDYPCGTKLNFYYNEEYNLSGSTSLSYRILNSQNRPVQGYGSLLSGTATSVAATRIYGDNRYELNVSGLSNGTYVLEVVNDKKEKFYLRFTKN